MNIGTSTLSLSEFPTVELLQFEVSITSMKQRMPYSSSHNVHIMCKCGIIMPEYFPVSTHSTEE